jgi:hypothetical protein
LVSGRLLYLVRHEDLDFQFAFGLPLSEALASRAGYGEALEFFQFLLVADGGAGLLEYFLGLRFSVRRLAQRCDWDCDGGDDRQDLFAHFGSPQKVAT